MRFIKNKIGKFVRIYYLCKKNIMKKVLLLALLISLTTIGFSQVTSYVYKLEIGNWNEYPKKWVWDDIVEVDLTFTLAKTYVSINDKSHTYLKIIEQDGKGTNDEDINTISWICTDEENRRCTFMMSAYKKSNVIIYAIVYMNKCFRYYIKKGDSKIDNY